MATDYFANAVYGVIVSDMDGERIRQEVSRIKEEDRRLFMDEAIDRLFSSDNKIGSRLLRDLRRTYKVPGGAFVHWTGSEDDRPGRCSTPTGVWILGFGMWSFPEVKIRKTGWKPNWHTWVEAG